MYRILSIDGGGIRGVIPAVLLVHLEKEIGRPIAEMFDLIVGTSTGGILAAGLAVGEGGRPKYSAQDMLDLYVEHGHEIFTSSMARDFKTGWGTLDEKYSHEPIEKLLEEYLGDKTLLDCVTSIVVTSYDIEERSPYFFKTSRAKEDPDRNHYLRRVARATSAAPTYFEPALVESLAPNPTRRVLVDGGVFVNNPAMCGYVEACAEHKVSGTEEIMVVSLGTGIATRKLPYEEARNWGKLKWVAPVISVMMDGQADSADYQLQQLFECEDEADQRYFRLDTELEKALDDLDAATEENIRDLEAEANQIIARCGAQIDRMVAILKQEKREENAAGGAAVA